MSNLLQLLSLAEGQLGLFLGEQSFKCLALRLIGRFVEQGSEASDIQMLNVCLHRKSPLVVRATG